MGAYSFEKPFVNSDDPYGPQKRGPRKGSPEAKRGGQAVVEKLGKPHFVRMSELGHKAQRDRAAAAGIPFSDIMAERGRKGHEAMLKKYGGKDGLREHLREAGRKGGNARRNNSSQ